MTTFSQLVDKIAGQSSRPDALAFISSQVNLTLRQLFFTDRNTPVFYSQSMLEDQVTSLVDTGFTWSPTNKYLFQAVRTIRFDDVLDGNGQSIYPTEVTPGRTLNDVVYSYYRTGDAFAFKGFGGVNAKVSIAWHEFVPTLTYFPDDATRPANFDTGTQVWTYQQPYLADVAPDDQAKAELLTTNWLLMRWEETIAEGTRAKLFKHLSDDSRARVSFSLFQGLREAVYRAEAVDSLRS